MSTQKATKKNSPTGGAARERNNWTWQDRLRILVKMLSKRSPRLRERMAAGATQEEMVETVLYEVRRYDMEVKLLQTKLQVQEAQSPQTKTERSSSSLSIPSSSPSSFRKDSADSPTSPASSGNSSTDASGAEREEDWSGDASMNVASSATATALTFLDIPTHPSKTSNRWLSNPMYRDAFMGSDCAYAVLSPQFRVIDCNVAFLDHLQYRGAIPHELNLASERTSLISRQPVFTDALGLKSPNCVGNTMLGIGLALSNGCFTLDNYVVTAPISQFKVDLSYFTILENAGTENEVRYICFLIRSYQFTTKPDYIKERERIQLLESPPSESESKDMDQKREWLDQQFQKHLQAALAKQRNPAQPQTRSTQQPPSSVKIEPLAPSMHAPHSQPRSPPREAPTQPTLPQQAQTLPPPLQHRQQRQPHQQLPSVAQQPLQPSSHPQQPVHSLPQQQSHQLNEQQQQMLARLRQQQTIAAQSHSSRPDQRLDNLEAQLQQQLQQQYQQQQHQHQQHQHQPYKQEAQQQPYQQQSLEDQLLQRLQQQKQQLQQQSVFMPASTASNLSQQQMLLLRQQQQQMPQSLFGQSSYPPNQTFNQSFQQPR